MPMIGKGTNPTEVQQSSDTPNQHRKQKSPGELSTGHGTTAA
jgi:hypothetical protein